ncbi:MAG: SUMF1/EgtB/PvdO family nonheme iron enzyme [Planctomycetales bacterium]
MARYPVLMDEQDFLNEIADDPGDVAPRLILADWLEERGDLRADLLRLQVDLLKIECPDRENKEAQLRALLYEKNVQPILPAFTNSIGMRFVQIPPGEFMMGATDEEAGRENERPRHPVTISRPFWLGVYLVTQEEYETVMEYNPSVFSAEGDRGDRVAEWDTRRFPVENISWEDAVEFCRRLSETESATGWEYRLPTEAEWEYACRAGFTTPFRRDDSDFSRNALAASVPRPSAIEEGVFLDRTTQVGTCHPNAFGLHDMRGNGWEWCLDGARDYSENWECDPLGPTGPDDDRVIRGGGWVSRALPALPGYRLSASPEWQGRIGIRCVSHPSSDQPEPSPESS